jgi:hypothetical protein
MRLSKARVMKYRSIKDTGWFDVEDTKTILVGPNEAGKTALLRALEQLNPGPGVAGFDPLRDYPRSELNDISRKLVDPKEVIVVDAEFELDDDDLKVVRPIVPGFDFGKCRYLVDRRLDNSSRAGLENGPTGPKAKEKVLAALRERLPIFVYFSAYFRVRPLIHLEHLATRSEQKLLDDDQYDFGNLCLLKNIGLTARELSDLGNVPEPTLGDAEALARYRAKLDERSYKLNAASVQLTQQIREVWTPDAEGGSTGGQELVIVRVQADRQYLKVVVEDELGVDIELDQRSEGFQWLVSFFTVFTAQSSDRYRNAILLLDEPGLSLHGLKQRDFRTTISQLAESNQILFTTHSPFLVGPDELDLVRVVEMPNRKAGTQVHTSVTAQGSAALLVLQEALGYDLAQSLFAQQRNLVLEGLTDFWYVESTSDLLRDSRLADLSTKIALLPAGGAGKVVYFATILHAHHLKVAALLDSDSAGEEAASQDTLVHTLGNKAVLRTKDAYTGTAKHPEIEDLLRETLLTVAKDSLGWDATAQAKAQPARSVVDLLSDLVGSQFSKYHLAKAYVRWTRDHTANDLTADERAQWTSLIENVNKALK